MESNNEKQLKFKELSILGDWVPRKIVKEFFGYGNTKMATFAEDFNIGMSKVGKRIFYRYSDLVRLIDEGEVNK